MIPKEYLSPTGEGENRLTVKGSRFIAWCAPAAGEVEALRLIEERSRRHHDATHNCWALRVGPPGSAVERSADAGEPSGTAGRPILDQLRRGNLSDCVLVVSRWFGGVKLGKGGLARAYAAVAAGAVAAVQKRTKRALVRFVVECDYSLIGAVQRAAAAAGYGIEPQQSAGSARFAVTVPAGEVERARELLTNATSGQIRIVG